MLRKLGLIIALSSALVIGKVNALGMGDIRVKSALNEPLHAEIELFQVKNLSPLQIKSRMADLNDFALSGLATQRALTAVRFQTRVRANGTGRIILTSKLPITEPFMNFLVEVNWPNGRLIREYTLLLDPSSYRSPQNNRNFTIRENTSSVAQRPVVSAKRQKAKPARSKANKTPKNITLKKGQYYISSKDTLWDIAIASRPSQKISPQRMMVLIQRKNPQAFPNANINVMTANVVIDLPTQAEIDALSGKEAEKEVNRQTKLWQSGTLPAVVIQTPAKLEPQTGKSPAVKSKQGTDKSAPAKANDETKQADDKKSADASGKTPAAEKGVAPAVATDKNTGKEQPDNLEKGMLNVVTAEESAAKRDLQAKADAMVIAASKDSEKIAELLKNNAEMGVKLALSQESIDKLERDNQELNKKLTTIIEQLADINRLIMLKDQQLAVMEDERGDAEKEQQAKAKNESDKSWLDRLLENPIGMATAGIGWLLAIIAGVFLLLRRKKKDQEEVLVEDKTEPSISLPDSVMESDEEALQELEELEKDGPAAAEDVIGDIDDLDLDLDLDMDMELDETLEGTSLVAGDAESDDEDLAAELEAQLNTTDEEDDDLDMLDGIDSLEFDLGEVEETELDLDEDDEEKRALAEFAAAMEAPDDENSAEDVTDSLELDNDELDSDKSDSFETDVLDSLGLDDAEQEEVESEPETAEQINDELEISFDSIEDELEIEIPENDEVSVEEDDLDISEIPDQVTSLDELAAMEDLAEAEVLDNTPAEEDLEEDSLEIDLNEDADDSDTEQAAEDEDEQPAMESAAFEEDQSSEPSAAENVFEEVMAANIENDLTDELEIEIPEASDTSESSVDTAEPSSNKSSSSEVLEEQLDELLGSTDDEIALEAVAPEFDADNEEEIDLLSGEDGMRMKLDLARAYIEMGDAEGAKDIIKEVMDAGEADHLNEAQELFDSIESKKK